MKKTLAAVLALLIVLSFCACGSKEETKDEYAIVLTDTMGNEVKMKEPAKTVVVLTAANCEIVYALGCGDRVIGRGEYCDYPEEVLSVTSVKSGKETNLEEIIALAPDIVICDSMEQSKEGRDMLVNAGIAVLVTDADTIELTYESIALTGKVLGKDEEAEKLIEDMKAGFENLQNEAKAYDLSGKTVYFEVSPLEWGLWTAGADTFMNEITSMFGVDNLFADTTGWVEVSQEQIIERDPDYIVTITMYWGEGPTPEEEIASRPGWENIKAVKEGKILCIDTDLITRPGPRLIEGAEALLDFYAAE